MTMRLKTTPIATPSGKKNTRHSTNSETKSINHLKKPLILGILLVILAALGGGVIHLVSIQRIQIEGNRQTSADTLQSILSGALEQSQRFPDLSAIKAALLVLPWVAEVEVSRRWPDILWIRIIEHQAVARWESAEGVMLLSASAIPIIPIRTLTQDMAQLPLLIGQDPVDLLQRYQRAQNELQYKGLSARQLRCDPTCRLTLADGLILVLGREEHDQTLQRFLRVYHHLVDGQDRPPIQQIDLRYAHGFAVQRAE
jgi:cell division protein FtsQ